MKRSKAQLHAISYTVTRITKERRWQIMHDLDLFPDFRASHYSSYGWYLKSKGITVTYNAVYVTATCEYTDKLREKGVVEVIEKYKTMTERYYDNAVTMLKHSTIDPDLIFAKYEGQTTLIMDLVIEDDDVGCEDFDCLCDYIIGRRIDLRVHIREARKAIMIEVE